MTYQLYYHEPGQPDARKIGQPNSKGWTTRRTRQLITRLQKNERTEDAEQWKFTRTDDYGESELYDRATGSWNPERNSSNDTEQHVRPLSRR